MRCAAFFSVLALFLAPAALAFYDETIDARDLSFYDLESLEARDVFDALQDIAERRVSGARNTRNKRSLDLEEELGELAARGRKGGRRGRKFGGAASSGSASEEGAAAGRSLYEEFDARGPTGHLTLPIGPSPYNPKSISSTKTQRPRSLDLEEELGELVARGRKGGRRGRKFGGAASSGSASEEGAAAGRSLYEEFDARGPTGHLTLPIGPSPYNPKSISSTKTQRPRSLDLVEELGELVARGRKGGRRGRKFGGAASSGSAPEEGAAAGRSLYEEFDARGPNGPSPSKPKPVSSTKGGHPTKPRSLDLEEEFGELVARGRRGSRMGRFGKGASSGSEEGAAAGRSLDEELDARGPTGHLTLPIGPSPYNPKSISSTKTSRPRSLDFEGQVSGRGLRKFASKIKGGIRKMKGGASPAAAGAEEPQARWLGLEELD